MGYTSRTDITLSAKPYKKRSLKHKERFYNAILQFFISNNKHQMMYTFLLQFLL